MKRSEIRDIVITGSCMIGPDGVEPPDWKSYALKLEDYIIDNNGIVVPIENQITSPKENVFSMEFLKWYSGMQEYQINNAFERYKREVIK